MNIAINPWSFVPGDPQTQTISTITLNADGTVTVVGTGNLTAGMVAGAFVTAIGVSNALYNGFYDFLTLSSATTGILVPQVNAGQPQIGRIPVGTAASSGGTIALNQSNQNVRIEDISWQNQTAAGNALDMRDRNGNVIWQAIATGVGAQNRGKIFWVNGITLIKIDSGIVLVTIN